VFDSRQGYVLDDERALTTPNRILEDRTMTNPQLTDLDDEQDFMDLIRANSRWVGIGAGIVLVVGLGWWVYTQSKLRKEQNAAQALFQAKQSMAAGNIVLAQSDLSKLVTRYGGTAGGAEGAMILAGIDYDQAKYQEGITVLENAAKGAPSSMEVQLRSLIGDGYLSMKNAPSAAKEFERAAGLSTYQLEKANQRAKAARAYMAGGDSAKAREIWTELAKDDKTPTVAAEAKVRLGELTAKPAKAS
jgi:predicted negative regulator of RcsB-dependent stress response